MMKKIIAVIMILLVMIIPVEASSDKSEIKLRFYLTAKDKYENIIEVKGNGYVLDGKQKIRAGTVKYRLSVGEKKSFKVVADIGNKIEYIKLQGKKIKTTNQEIIVKGVSGKQKVEVKFKKEAGISNNTLKPDTQGNASQLKQGKQVKTGDIDRIDYLILMILTMMLISGLMKRHIKHA